MENEDEITIEVPTNGAASTPAEDDLGAPIEKADGEQKGSKPGTAEEGIEDLKSQLAAERAALAAEREQSRAAREEAAQLAQHRQALEGRVVNSDMQLVLNAIDATKKDQQAAKIAYREAMERGDYDAAAEAQETIATGAARLNDLDRGKAAMENRQRQAQLQREQKVDDGSRGQQQRQVQQDQDPVEAYIANFSKPSQEWLRRNRQCVTDQRMNSKVIGAHHMALGENITPDTPEYFAFLEKQVGIKSGGGESRGDREERTSGANVSAPVSRDVPSSSRIQGNKVTLNAAQREIAKLNGLTDAEYAAQLIIAHKNGELSTS